MHQRRRASLSWQSGPLFLVDLLCAQTHFARLRQSNDCLTLSRLVATHPPASHAHLAAHHIHQHNSVNTHHEHTPLTPRSSPCPSQHIDATHTHSSWQLIALSSSPGSLISLPTDTSLTRPHSCPSLLRAPHKTSPVHVRLMTDGGIQFTHAAHASVLCCTSSSAGMTVQHAEQRAAV